LTIRVTELLGGKKIPLEDTDHLIKHGDCVEIMRKMNKNSVDAIVTDPPAGIGFMGKEWDSDKGGRVPWITWMAEVMTEGLRVLKPGGHALVWALPRTSHWTATALELAGFEVRDVVTHHFGTGFPKSLNVSKAIDRAAGAERDVVGTRVSAYGDSEGSETSDGRNLWCKPAKKEVPLTGGAVTLEAQQWDGWGTALKPASEHWILVRKPLTEGTVAANVLAYGTGALNIDACRVPGQPASTRFNPEQHQHDGWRMAANGEETAENAAKKEGRWPTDLLLSHAPDCDITCVEACPVADMDAQSGQRTSGKMCANTKRNNRTGYTGAMPVTTGSETYGDSGGASRFFPIFRYQAKPSGAEKNAGVEMNDHPTVKSVELMRWLCRLVTPPQGIVLDPFCGSGSTGVACIAERFRFIGIEQDTHNCEIANGRLDHARKQQGA
jgi:hypothetical protein